MLGDQVDEQHSESTASISCWLDSLLTEAAGVLAILLLRQASRRGAKTELVVVGRLRIDASQQTCRL